MKILVCGDRFWSNIGIVTNTLSKVSGDSIIIHGCCKGADIVAANVAKRLGMVVNGYPANWELHGKAAGPIRNREMLDLLPDLVIAFHDNIANSRGTKDCVTEAISRKIKVMLINLKGEVIKWNF